jgi:hypothetical protein
MLLFAHVKLEVHLAVIFCVLCDLFELSGLFRVFAFVDAEIVGLFGVIFGSDGFGS